MITFLKDLDALTYQTRSRVRQPVLYFRSHWVFANFSTNQIRGGLFAAEWPMPSLLRKHRTQSQETKYRQVNTEHTWELCWNLQICTFLACVMLGYRGWAGEGSQVPGLASAEEVWISVCRPLDPLSMTSQQTWPLPPSLKIIFHQSRLLPNHDTGINK